MNGLWLLLLLGRWSMVTGWLEYIGSCGGKRQNKEFVSADARGASKGESRSYEMLSHSKGESVSLATADPVKIYGSPDMNSPDPEDGRRTPDYFGQPAPDYWGETARYQPHQRSFSAPRPPQNVHWDGQGGYGSRSPPPPMPSREDYPMNPLGMNKI